ncbi:MAG: DUF1735 domain-containing protein [Niabella sp.]
MKKYLISKLSNSILALSALFIFSLSSCLKEGGAFPTSEDTNGEFVELGSAQTPDSYTTSYQAFSLSAKFVNDTAGFYVIVMYTGKYEYAPEDITLTLSVDSAALNTYNTENETEYALFDDEMLSYPKTVTIAKGTDRTRFRVTVNDTTGFDFSTSYGLPLKIASTTYGTITANTSTKIYAFTAQNVYDGVYTVTGSMTDASLSGATGLYPKTVHLVSVGSADNLYLDASTYSTKYNYYFFLNAGATTYYGNFCPIFHFDGTSVVSVTNAYGQGTGTNSSSRYAELNSSGINTVTFDSDGLQAQTIKVSYQMGSGTPGSGTIRTTITEVYTYAGSR